MEQPPLALDDVTFNTGENRPGLANEYIPGTWFLSQDIVSVRSHYKAASPANSKQPVIPASSPNPGSTIY